MRKLFYTASFAIVLLSLGAGHTPHRSLHTILNGIATVESNNGKNHNDGDNGKAIGDFQIWEAYWEDSGVEGSWEDCRNHKYAEKVVVAYWQRYCPDALDNLDYETLSRVHNGGPKGDKRQATLGYWHRVQKALK